MGDGDRPRTVAGPLAHDALLAVVCAVGETAIWFAVPREIWPGSWAVALSWMYLSYAAIVLRRVAPRTAVAVLGAHVIVSSSLSGAQFESGTFPVFVLTYTLAASYGLAAAIGGTLLIWVPPATISLVIQDNRSPLGVAPEYLPLTSVMGALACFFIGRTVHNRRAFVAALEDRARTAESNQRALAEQAVADERRRIARELHDVVAHHVSVMSVLATGSRRALHHDPDAADEALATIEETGRTTLREMRRLLSVLRTDAEPAGELEPQPGLPGLETLLEQVCEAGLPVMLTTTGEPYTLDPGIALAVYRITQEALTNSLKHAGPASAEVHLRFATRELTIEITDNGRGPNPGLDHIGHGLLGMRERINLYGGTLRVGPRPGGGFRVKARIPVDGTGVPA